MAGPQFAQSFNADDSTVVSFEMVGDAIGNVDIGVGVIGNSCGVHGESIGASKGTRVVPVGTGVHGRGELNGVFGEGRSHGVYGLGESTLNQPETTTGVLGEGYKEASGVVGLNFVSDQKQRVFGHGAGVIGASNADSE